MRRFLVGLVVATAAVVVPSWAMAGSPNEDSAQRIAASLKESGKLHGYKIGVKYQDGMVWLKGEVSSREQMKTAVELVAQMPGVTRVVNNLATVSPEAASKPALRQPQSMAAGYPLGAADKVQQAIAQLMGKQTPSRDSQPASQPVQSLRSVDGALAAEQLPRTMTRDVRTGPAPTAQVAGVAERVPTSFTPSTVRPVNVTVLQEPTLAPPRSIATAAPQPPAAEPAPAPAVAQTLAGGPAPSPTPIPNGAPLPMAQTGARCRCRRPGSRCRSKGPCRWGPRRSATISRTCRTMPGRATPRTRTMRR